MMQKLSNTVGMFAKHVYNKRTFLAVFATVAVSLPLALHAELTYQDRLALQKNYLAFASRPAIAHQVFTLDRHLNILEGLSCERFNFSHLHMRTMVTESENHRLGVGFINDVQHFVATERLSPRAAAQKVKQMVVEDDEQRPSIYENEKRWPRIENWIAAHNVKVKLDARPQIYDLEYYLFLRRQRSLPLEQAVVAGSPLFDKEYQAYLKARYKKGDKQASTRPEWELKLETYRNALALLNSEGASRPLVSQLELNSCLNTLRTGFYAELAEKRKKDPNYSVDQEWYNAMNGQFRRIQSILGDVAVCDSYEREQNRRIELARSYTKSFAF